MTRLVKKVTNVRYHRNGVGGEPFYAVEFTPTASVLREYDGVSPMTAVIFPEHGDDGEPDWDRTTRGNPKVAVLSGDIDHTWRGDQFADELCEAVKAWDHGLLHGLPEGYFDEDPEDERMHSEFYEVQRAFVTRELVLRHVSPEDAASFISQLDKAERDGIVLDVTPRLMGRGFVLVNGRERY